MRLEWVREEDHEIDSAVYDCGTDLLISAEWPAGEPGDIQPELGAQYRASRTRREEIVVHEDAAIAPHPVEKVVLPVVVGDQSNMLPWCS